MGRPARYGQRRVAHRRFQSPEWAGEFLYEREWPKFVHHEEAAADVLPQPGCTEHVPCGTCSLCEPDLARRGVL
ncbi:hypothetical protein GCM10009647_076660 [Streptomyces sanglieri]|uniref:Uncharacterized protein n=1 Tax=Streptomyces sanglieri TaxID=193460 RepID=A0ABW2WQ22_9ACTN